MEVTVLSSEAGLPLENVGVELKWGVDWSYSSSSYTDSNGTCDFRLLPEGDFRLCVGSNLLLRDFVDTESVEIPVAGLRTGENRSVTVVLRTAPDVLIHARILDSVTMEPIPHAWADLFNPDLARLDQVDDRCQRITAAEDGWLQCRIPSWRIATARIGGPGHAVRFALLSLASTSIDSPEILLLDPLGTLEIVVLDERSQPARGIRVRLEEEAIVFEPRPDRSGITLGGEVREAVTDGEGHARFEGLPPCVGLYASLARDRVFDGSAARQMVLSPGEVRTEVLRLVETSLQGIARDPRGRVAAGLQVWLVPCEGPPAAGLRHAFLDSDGARAQRTTTDRNGRFSFLDVLPGSWWIGPAPPGDPPAHGYAPSAQAIEVLASDLVLEVLLTLEPAR